MARTKAKAGATSKIWLMSPGAKFHRSDDPAAPKDWTHFCDEGDGTWTKRGNNKGDADGKP